MEASTAGALGGGGRSGEVISEKSQETSPIGPSRLCLLLCGRQCPGTLEQHVSAVQAEPRLLGAAQRRH